jgi:hypothetical protein
MTAPQADLHLGIKTYLNGALIPNAASPLTAEHVNTLTQPQPPIK